MNLQQQEADERSAVEKFLTVLAYRPKTKTWEESMMIDVRELARMRLAGERLPSFDELPGWRRQRATQGFPDERK